MAAFKVSGQSLGKKILDSTENNLDNGKKIRQVRLVKGRLGSKFQTSKYW